MQEVLDILIARVPHDSLSAVETRSVDKYREIRANVVAAVEAVKPADETTTTNADVDDWLDRLAKLRDADPDQFDRMARRIGQFLAAGGPKPPAKVRKHR